MSRYDILTTHGETGTTYNVVDTAQPEEEQPAVVIGWTSPEEPNAQFLALDFCRRHNAKE